LPPIRLEFMPGTLDEAAVQRLKEVLKIDAAERYSVSSRQMKPGDFGVLVDELHPWSEPTHDLVARMDLHNDPERLAKNIDAEAQEVADLIAATLMGLRVEQDVTVGVAPMYGTVGWGTSAATRSDFFEDDR